MTESTMTARAFVGGPLDGQDAAPGNSPYRLANGTAASTSYGDDRLLRAQWQAGDTGIYCLAHNRYRWIGAP